MKIKIFTLFTALCLVCTAYASNVITYTAFAKLSESNGLHTNAFNVSISSHEFADGQGTITFAGEVTSIGERAFYGCSGLTSVTIPNSVTSIGDDAFYYCDGLTSVTIPNSVTSIGDDAFYYCSGLTSVNITDLAAWCKIDFGGCESNPLIYAHHLYLNNTEITDLVIPSTVSSIKQWAFEGCSGLTSVTIPNSVTSIGDYAFCDCSGLTAVTIPNGVTKIGDDAFFGCSGLTSVTIPNSVTSIGECAFYWSGLTSVTIPNSVTSIGDYAFCDCIGLTAVTIPNGVTKIGNGAFYECSGLTSVTIPNSVTSIGEVAFYGCTKLKTVYNLSDLNIVKGATTHGWVAYYADVVYTGTSTNVSQTELQGVYAENGRIVCENAQDLHIYTLTGVDVTKENGHLQGVYIVKCGDQTQKIVVR